MNKEQLLNELEELGVHRSGRKVRADKGLKRQGDQQPRKSRSDAGISRQGYTQTAAHYKRVFSQLLNMNNTDIGDTLTRDINMIFPPNITNIYKLVRSKKGHTYRSSIPRANHPEALRWRWWFEELEESNYNQYWQSKICDWYFIKPEDLSSWTYSEWAWSYVTQIDSHENRLTKEPIILDYLDFIKGLYGKPIYNQKGDIDWNAKEII